MRLLNLRLSNWTCHPGLDLDLSRSLQISGRNGAGKSSILEAIRFLFSETAAGFKSRIKNGERSTNLSLTFTKDNSTHCLEKTLYVDKPSEALLTTDGTQVADNPSSVYEALQNVLTEEILDRLLYVPQNGLTTIIDNLARKGGRQELDGLFGLDRLERVYKACGEKIREEDVRVGLLSERLAQYPKDALAEYGSQIEEFDRKLSELKAKKRELTERIESLKRGVSSVEGKITETKKIRDERNRVSEEIKKLEVSLAENRKGLEAFTEKIEKISEKKSEIEALDKQLLSLEKYKKIHALLQDKKSILEKIEGLGNLEEDQAKLGELSEKAEQKKVVEKEVSAKEAAIKEIETSYASMNHELKTQQQYLDGLSGLGDKAVCPRCRQRLNKAHIFSEEQSAKLKIKNLTVRVANVKVKLSGEQEELTKLKTLLAKLVADEAASKHLKESLGKRSKEKDCLEKKANELSFSLSEAGYAGEELSNVEDKTRKLSELEGRKKALLEETAKEEEFLKSKRVAEEELGKLTDRTSNLASQLSELSYDEKEFDRLLAEKDEKNKKLSEKKGERDKLDYMKSETESKKKEVHTKKEEYLKTVKEKNDAEKKRNLLARAREVFHTDKGLPKYLRDKFLRQLGDLLTYYYTRFNQNPVYKEVSFDKDYSIQLSTTSGALSCDQLSGGEKVQLAIALRIALIEMLSPIRLLILDEPFGSLDRDHRELLGEALNKMGASWQLIVVTHVPVDSLQLENLELEGY